MSPKSARHIPSLLTLLLTAALLPLASLTAQAQGAYQSGVYRNLFAESGHTQAEIDARIESTFQQLFHGDAKTQAVVFADGSNANGPLMYLSDVANHDVRTEGMSYGMMVAVELGKKAEFDALWNWAMTHMYIADPKHPAYGYFAWSCQTNGVANEETPAPDGEEYFAMSLLFAANRWPGGEGIYDYRAQAWRLLRAMRHRTVISGATNHGPRTVGAEIDEAHGMILFVPGVMPHPFTDPSYHLPAFYELWALWGPPEDRAFWRQAAETSREFFVKTAHPETGLSPVYAEFDGAPHASNFDQSAAFGFDAWRVAINWAVDWSWWGRDARERELSDRIQRFFESKGIDSYGGLYTLDGKTFRAKNGSTMEDHSTGLVGANAVAGLAATDKARARRFAEALWRTPVPTGPYRYYDGMLYLMSMMHAGGRFRILAPAQ
jgi:oligosaccharide reducing-end xylanase